MKKIHLLFAGIIMLISFHVDAQVKSGIKGGVNFTTMKFSADGHSYTPDRAAKVHFGVYFNHMLSDNITISPELLYSAVGFKPDKSSLVDDITLQYIAIPVLLKFYPAKNLNLHAGPQLGILVGGTEINGQSITEGTKTTELAFAIGAEGFFNDNIGVGVRYLPGITNTDDTDSGLDQKSDIIQLSLLVSFN